MDGDNASQRKNVSHSALDTYVYHKTQACPLIDRKPTIHRGRYLLKRSGVENDGCGFFLHEMNRRWKKVSFESLYMFIFQPVNNFRPNQIFHQVAHRDAIIQLFKDVFHAGPLV